ncbi:MAG: acyl-CoA carboxylase subunit beta [Gammaproteobacteria bacterium]
MSVFESQLDKQTTAFEANRADMIALVDKLHAVASRADKLSEKRRARFAERGQFTPRERLSHLLDPGMPFLELFGLAGFLVDDANPETSVPGASCITGIGFVSGVRCMILVDDSGINAGAATHMTLEKIAGAMDIAMRMKLPFVHLVESAGANLIDYRVETWAHGGGLFFRLARLSAAGIPTITVLHGPSTAGGAYMPGMSDYVVGVKGRGRAALAGAALLHAATGEIADEDELGGAAMHASVSGLVEYLADDDAHALQITRDIVRRLQWNRRCNAAHPAEFSEPVYSPDELAGLVPVDHRKPYDVNELIARIVDGSEFESFKPRFGASTVCVTASVRGYACGIIGNNGPIDPNGACKAAQFFQLCDQADQPILFLNNTTGYMVGTQYEQAGMIKHGSKMIQAASNVRVPRITLYVGASFGAGNYGMCGLGYEPDFLFSWPNAKTGVMGGKQAAGTMSQVARVAAKRRGIAIDEQMLAAQEKRVTDLFDNQSDAFYTSGRVLDQGIIDPRDTRKVLSFTLETCAEARQRELRPNAFGVARL